MIECIGFLLSKSNEKFYIYKLTIGDRIYRVDDLGFIQYSLKNKEENHFSPSLTKEDEKVWDKKIKKAEKVENQLILSKEKGELFIGESDIFPKIEKETIIVNNSKTKNGIFSEREMINLLEILCNEFDCIKSRKKYSIHDEMIEFAEEYGIDISFLKDFVFENTVDGYHKNDGQMVEYCFTFTSPNGIKTNFSTEMCLMVGWNVCNKVKFNK